MTEKLKRRTFLSRTLAGAAGGILFGIPVMNWSCNSGKKDHGETDSEGMILIPSGIFLKGTPIDQARKLSAEHGYHESWVTCESPEQKINLPSFRIDKYPVTNEQYERFCAETGHNPPSHWSGPKSPEAILRHPVSHVNHFDASAYAKWAGKRLPVEAEWEKAARGTDGRLFPWGNNFKSYACCWNRTGEDGVTTDPVDAHPLGASPYGIMDMAGNLFEWCSDGPGGRSCAFIKGGGWITTEILDLRSAARGNSGATNNASAFYGFRCVKEVLL